jgi:hypothetical protein
LVRHPADVWAASATHHILADEVFSPLLRTGLRLDALLGAEALANQLSALVSWLLVCFFT